MIYLGDFAEDSTVYISFTTNDKSGGAVAPSSAFEAADVKIYKNGSATEKATTNGLTMTSPFDSITGLHLLAIDTSNDTGDSGFWVAGADYIVVLNPDETIDSETVAAVIAEFSIENRFVDSRLIKAAKVIINKAVQTKATGAVVYYDDDDVTPLVTHTPTDSSTQITRTPS